MRISGRTSKNRITKATLVSFLDEVPQRETKQTKPKKKQTQSTNEVTQQERKKKQQSGLCKQNGLSRTQIFEISDQYTDKLTDIRTNLYGQTDGRNHYS